MDTSITSTIQKQGQPIIPFALIVGEDGSPEHVIVDARTREEPGAMERGFVRCRELVSNVASAVFRVIAAVARFVRACTVYVFRALCTAAEYVLTLVCYLMITAVFLAMIFEADRR